MEKPTVHASLVFIFVSTMFALLTLYFMLIPRKHNKEYFANYYSTGVTFYNVYQQPDNKTPQDIDSAVSAQRISMDDKNDLLHMRRCYQFPNQTIESLKALKAAGNAFKHKVEGGMYVLDFDMVTCSFSDVQSKIVCELQKFQEQLLCKSATGPRKCTSFPYSRVAADVHTWKPLDRCPLKATAPTPVVDVVATCDTKIQGPVYALLFQAPFYRSESGAEVTAQFNVADFDNLPYTGSKDADAPIYYYVQLLFARYNKNAQLSSMDFMRDYFIPYMDARNFSKERHCYIASKNNITRPNLPGGCSSTEGYPYAAKCLGPADPSKHDKNDRRETISSYGILHEINPNHAIMNTLLNVGQAQMPREAGCGKFSSEKYAQAYPNVPRQAALKHWATEGIRKGMLGFVEGRETAGGLWSESNYLKVHADVKRSRMDPLAHLQNYGWKENRTICLSKPM